MVQVLFRREDRVHLVVGHEERALGGVDGGGGQVGVRVDDCLGRLNGVVRRGEQRRGLVGIVLECSQDRTGVDAGNCRQLFPGSLHVRQLFREAFLCLGQAGRQCGALGAFRAEGGLCVAQQTQLRVEFVDDLRRKAFFFRRVVRRAALLVEGIPARQGLLRLLDAVAELFGRGDAELRAGVVPLLLGVAYLLIGLGQAILRLLDQPIGVSLCGLVFTLVPAARDAPCCRFNFYGVCFFLALLSP